MDNESLIGKRFIWKRQEFRIVKIIDELQLLGEDENGTLFTFNRREHAESPLYSKFSFDLEREEIYAQWLLYKDEIYIELDLELLELKPPASIPVGRPTLTMLFDIYTHEIHEIYIEA